MSTYIKLSTLKYPRYEGDIRLDHPEITEDQTGATFSCPNTYAAVTPVQMPECNYEIQCVEELPPVQIDGVWTQRFLVRDLTVEELEARARRSAEIAQRNAQQR